MRKSRPNWHLRLVGNGIPADYTLTVSGLAPYKALPHGSLEGADELAISATSFELSGQIGSDVDGVDLYLQQQSTLTVEVTVGGVPVMVPVLIGANSIDGGSNVITVPGNAIPAVLRRGPR